MNIKVCEKIIIIFLFSFFIAFPIQASSKLQGIENFPDSYKPYLEEIK